MNKAIVEMNVKGTASDGTFHGTLNAYPNSISKLGKKPRLNLLESFRTGISKIPSFVSNIVLSPRVLTVGLAIIIAGSLSACTLAPDAKTTPESSITIVEEEKEPTYDLEYKVKSGDNLWKIAGKYYSNDGDIANEVSRICAKNNLDAKAILRDGTVIKISVPYSSLEQFGYTAEYTGPSEWDMMDYFAWNSFENPKKISHTFLRDKENVVTGLRDDIYIIDPSLLLKAAKARYELEEMEKEPYFYDDESIARKKAEIDGYYAEAVQITESATGCLYGVDFVLDGEYNIIPLDNTLGK